MCKANRRRRLANYIRSKSRQDSESAIEEEEEEEQAGKQQQ
jgi:ribosomal protein S15P/S13E